MYFPLTALLSATLAVAGNPFFLQFDTAEIQAIKQANANASTTSNLKPGQPLHASLQTNGSVIIDTSVDASSATPFQVDDGGKLILASSQNSTVGGSSSQPFNNWSFQWVGSSQLILEPPTPSHVAPSGHHISVGTTAATAVSRNNTTAASYSKSLKTRTTLSKKAVPASGAPHIGNEDKEEIDGSASGSASGGLGFGIGNDDGSSSAAGRASGTASGSVNASGSISSGSLH